MNEILPHSEILKQNTEWKTTIFFTKKSLFHILEQHSETHWSEKAREIWKIYFRDQQEIENLADIILQDLTSEIEYERANGIYIPYDSKFPNKVSHISFKKDWIVQLKPIWKNAFEIVSFYKNKDLKWRSPKK